MPLTFAATGSLATGVSLRFRGRSTPVLPVALVALLIAVLVFAGQILGQVPAKGLEGSWQGTLDAGGQKLRLALTISKSADGVYSGKLDSLDQGSTIPIDTITIN